MTLPKKMLIPCLSLSFSLLSVFFFCVPTSFAKPMGPTQPEPHAICKDKTIPPGWIITEIYNDDWQQCRNQDRQNAIEIIEPPPTQTTPVCSISPIPAGFVIVNQSSEFRPCGTFFANTFTITPAKGPSLDVCASSPIPDQWVISAESSAFTRSSALLTCQQDAATQKGIGILQRTIVPVTGTAMRVCADSPVPSGYHKLETIALVSCPGDLPPGTSLLIAPV